MKVKAIDGMPVIDAKKPLRITIVTNDIAKADHKEPDDCAVARALRRETKCLEARVHLGRVYVRSNTHNWVRYMTPRSMRSEIISFDRGGTFEPGTFLLSAPSTSKALGKKRGGKAFRRGAGKKRQKPHVVENVRGGPA